MSDEQSGSDRREIADSVCAVLADLIDALHDEMAVEVGKSTHVMDHIERACRVLGYPYTPYLLDYPWSRQIDGSALPGQATPCP